MAARAGDVPITVDFAKPAGKIKPLHGVNNGPLAVGENPDLSVYHAEAAFPHTRLHDCRWPAPDVVDVPCIFPIFDADPDDPKNYCFAKTDDYLAAILKNKSQIIYRLGTSIEIKTKYFIHPPKDFPKWAKICVNIIRHYNEGWANGFRHNIRYWEIWNEPEINLMWLGTREQYFQLYETAARAIKAHDANLKVGGPAATNVGSAIVKPFLALCRDRNVPLDFFSFHGYYNVPGFLSRDAVKARALLDEYGFKTTESHLNEWHFLRSWNELRPKDASKYPTVREAFAKTCNADGAAFCATALMQFQDAPLDVANFYCADTSPWSMFDTFGVPSKVYTSFKAFAQLAATPDRVVCEGAPDDVVVCAGTSADKKTATILLSNFRSAQQSVAVSLKNLPSQMRAEISVLDATRDLERTREENVAGEKAMLKIDLASATVVLVRLSTQ
jgi:hypothetical protein